MGERGFLVEMPRTISQMTGVSVHIPALFSDSSLPYPHEHEQIRERDFIVLFSAGKEIR